MRYNRYIAGGIVCFLAAAVAGYGYVSHEPFSAGGLVEVRGRVVEAVERETGTGAAVMELRLADNPTLFRVPVEAYEMVPDRAALRFDLGQRPRVTLGVDSASLRNPVVAITGASAPAAFVSTLSTARGEYLTNADWVKWYRAQRDAKRNVMLGGLVVGSVLLAMRNRAHVPAPARR